jgi:ABC-type Mn2+/Zn2+ transport system permease subunit
MLGIATLTGVLCGVVGAYASYFLNGSTGGCIVVLQTVIFLVALTFAPKHGLLAANAQRRAASA